MKKYITLLLLCYLIFSALPADAVVINLSPRECEEALAFGKEHRYTIEKELDKRYAFGSSEEYADGGTIQSKWYKLALMAGYKEQRGEALTAQEIADLYSSYATFVYDGNGNRVSKTEGGETVL